MPGQVNISDKTFGKHISSDAIARRVKDIGMQMNEDYKGGNPVFLPILNGSFFFASDLLKHIEFPYEISFVKIASYVGMNSGSAFKTLIGADESLVNRNIIIVEDIIDTGRTVFELCNELKEIPVSDIKIASLIFKPGSLKYDVAPNYYGFESGNEFLIGYGLDFDRKGRHFKDIYKLIEE